MKRRAITILLCAVLLVSVCVPGTLAFQTSDGKTPAEGQEVQTATEAATEAPTLPSEQTPAEETVPVEADLEQCPAAHIDGCSEDCTGENCVCGCHEKSLFERIMVCTTLEEIEDLFASATEEELASITEEQWAEIDARIESLEPAPAPPVVLEISAPPVMSEIVSPTVNFTNVAPFGDPVVGGK